jgi:hypothetical protein
VQKLRTPLLANAIYLVLLGIATLAPSLTRSVFGYDVKDPGVLLVLSGIFLGYGLVVWGIASDVEKHGGLALFQVIALVIGSVFLIWGWAGNLFTVRNALVPLIINIVLVVWIWSARPKAVA